MFQVATHPAAFNLHSHGRPQPQYHLSPSQNVQLPRTLTRPPFAEVSRDAISVVAPDLANVPAEYIRRGLRPKANQMLAGISALSSSHMPTSIPRSQLPGALSIPIRTSSAQPAYPSHVLAVSSTKPSSNESAIIFPIHAIVLASHCASLPRLPPSPSQHSSVLQIPVLQIALPSPAAFHILHSFLYTHRLDSVLQALLPLPAGFLQGLSHPTIQSTLSSGTTLHQLSNYLYSASGSNLQSLTMHAAHVKELWQDMVALGLHDPELWDTVDLAWEVVLGALNLAASAQ